MLAETMRDGAPMHERSSRPPAAGAIALVADDDARFRALFARMLTASGGVASVVAAADGAEAVALATELPVDLVVLDLNMPGADGVEAAERIRALRPALPIAVQSADPELLRVRADGLDLPLFDKLAFDEVLGWVERCASERDVVQGTVSNGPVPATRDLRCGRCGYGIAVRIPPTRCPLCGEAAAWAA
jgi:CheY-like chemotaxis protein